MKIHIILICTKIILCLIFIASCGSSNTGNNNSTNNLNNLNNSNNSNNYKLTPDYENFTLSWGNDNVTNDNITGYSLSANGKIEMWQQNRNTREKTNSLVTTINSNRIGEILKYTNNAYLYTSALNEPGKNCCFVELRKPNANFYSKATWNEHKTYGSRLFRNLYDTLMTLVPSY